MDTPPRISLNAIVSLFIGIAAFTFGALSLEYDSDLYFVVAIVCCPLAITLAAFGLRSIARSDGRLRGSEFAAGGILVPFAGILLGYLIADAAWFARDNSMRGQAASKMREIGAAFNDYDAHVGQLPPVALLDTNGRPLLSWRVLLLPYLGERELFKEFHLDETWDSPHNIALLPRMPHVFRAVQYPADERMPEESSTFCQVFTGKGTIFDGTQRRTLAQVADEGGTSNVILAIEAGTPVPWTKPADLEYDDDKPLPPLGGVFPGKRRLNRFGERSVNGFHILLADAHTVFIWRNISDETLRSAIRRKEGNHSGKWE
jgi:hypothetical protein